MRTSRKAFAIFGDHPGILGDLSRLLLASDARGRLWRRGHHLDSDALYLDPHRLPDPCAQGVGGVAQPRGPSGTADSNGQLPLLQAGAQDLVGKLWGQHGADVLEDRGTLISSALQVGEPSATSLE